MKIILGILFFSVFPFFCFSQPFGLGDKTTPAEINSLPKYAELKTRDILGLPAFYSLKMYAPPVGNQGPYATCTAWSAAYAARTISYSIRKSMIDKDSIKKYSFSPPFLYYYIKKVNDKNCDSGASIRDAMSILKSKGALLKDSDTAGCVNAIADTVAAKAAEYKIKDYLAIDSFGRINKDGILKIKKSISEKRPVIISIRFYDSFRKVDSLTGYWINDTTDIPHKEALSGHAMCITGYDDDVNGGAFEVMNSWGDKWGRKGFFWLSYKQFEDYGRYAIALTDFR
ncbi:MAG: C1 family peptidase [Bacteroidota bacterium]